MHSMVVRPVTGVSLTLTAGAKGEIIPEDVASFLNAAWNKHLGLSNSMLSNGDFLRLMQRASLNVAADRAFRSKEDGLSLKQAEEFGVTFQDEVKLVLVQRSLEGEDEIRKAEIVASRAVLFAWLKSQHNAPKARAAKAGKR